MSPVVEETETRKNKALLGGPERVDLVESYVREDTDFMLLLAEQTNIVCSAHQMSLPRLLDSRSSDL